MRTKVDLYEILGVSHDAAAEEIKRAYRKLARQYHPDVNSEQGSDERFKEINLAYEVLSDPQKRRQYDTFGTTGHPGGGADPFGGMGFGSLNDIFDFFFGGGAGFGTAARGQYYPGEDLHRAIHLKLTDCLEDYLAELTLQRRELCDACRGSRAEPGSQPTACPTCAGQGAVRQVRDTLLGRMATTTACPACQGEGVQITEKCQACRGRGMVEKQRRIEVTVPAGIDSGMVIRVPEQGHAGLGGAPAGDLLVSVTVEPHEHYARQAADLFVELPVHYADLVQGTTVNVPTLTGEESLRIPAGTASHHEFVLRGHGLPRVRGGGRGDLRVRVTLAVPRRQGKRQKELLGELKEADLAAGKRADTVFYRLLKHR